MGTETSEIPFDVAPATGATVWQDSTQIGGTYTTINAAFSAIDLLPTPTQDNRYRVIVNGSISELLIINARNWVDLIGHHKDPTADVITMATPLAIPLFSVSPGQHVVVEGIKFVHPATVEHGCVEAFSRFVVFRNCHAINTTNGTSSHCSGFYTRGGLFEYCIGSCGTGGTLGQPRGFRCEDNTVLWYCYGVAPITTTKSGYGIYLSDTSRAYCCWGESNCEAYSSFPVRRIAGIYHGGAGVRTYHCHGSVTYDDADAFGFYVGDANTPYDVGGRGLGFECTGASTYSGGSPGDNDTFGEVDRPIPMSENHKTFLAVNGDRNVPAVDQVVVADTSGGVVTLTLPNVDNDDDGVVITFKRQGGNNLVLNRNDADTIDGATSYSLTVDDEFVVLTYKDPGEWLVIGKG